MNEIQNSIQERLSRTRELSSTLFKLKNKHLNNIEEEENHIIKYRNQQNLRAFKQTDMLVHLQNKQFHSESQLKEFYLTSVQICSFYDNQYQIFLDEIQEFNMSHIQRLYIAFFAQHGIKRRSREMASFLKKTYNDVNPAIYFGWLIQWSRIKYCQALDMIQTFYREMKMQMNRQKKMTKKIINQIQEQGKRQTQGVVKKKNISLSIKPFQNGPTTQQKEKKNIYLFNKDSVCSYFIDELTNYYRYLAIEDLDLNALKCIKKQGKKEDLFFTQNLSKTIQFLIQNKNKEQMIAITKYEADYKKSKFGAKYLQNSLKAASKTTIVQKQNPIKSKFKTSKNNQTKTKASFTQYMNLNGPTQKTFIRLSKTHKFVKQKLSASERSIIAQKQQQVQDKNQNKDKDKDQDQNLLISLKQEIKQTINTNYNIQFPHIQKLKRQKQSKIFISHKNQNNQRGKRRVKRQSILGDQFYVVPKGQGHQASKSTKLPDSIKLSKLRESGANLINQHELFIQTRSFSKDSLIHYSSGKSSFVKNPEGSGQKQTKSNFKFDQTKEISKPKQSQKSLLYKILGHTPNFDDKQFMQNRKNQRQINQKLNSQRQLAVLKKLRKRMQIKGVIIREMNNLIIE